MEQSPGQSNVRIFDDDALRFFLAICDTKEQNLVWIKLQLVPAEQRSSSAQFDPVATHCLTHAFIFKLLTIMVWQILGWIWFKSKF